MLLNQKKHNFSGISSTFSPMRKTKEFYTPFGVSLKNRDFSSEKYRYGMNGQESVDEVTGSKLHYIAEYWMYDSRIGRRWNIDPVDQVERSNYACFNNNPLIFSDPNGDNPFLIFFGIGVLIEIFKQASGQAIYEGKIDFAEMDYGDILMSGIFTAVTGGSYSYYRGSSVLFQTSNCMLTNASASYILSETYKASTDITMSPEGNIEGQTIFNETKELEQFTFEIVMGEVGERFNGVLRESGDKIYSESMINTYNSQKYDAHQMKEINKIQYDQMGMAGNIINNMGPEITGGFQDAGAKLFENSSTSTSTTSSMSLNTPGYDIHEQKKFLGPPINRQKIDKTYVQQLMPPEIFNGGRYE